MKFDQGLGVFGLAGLALAFTALLSVGFPIISSQDPVKLSDWLGFAGNVIGAGVALLAATIAWFAVQRQIDEQRRTTESQRRDAADLRLSAFTLQIWNLWNEFETIKTTKDKLKQFEKLGELSASPESLAIVVDPLMGGDQLAVTLFLTSLRNAAPRLAGAWKSDPDGRNQVMVALLFHELTNNIVQRRAAMRRGSVDDLVTLSLINLPRYVSYQETGVWPS